MATPHQEQFVTVELEAAVNGKPLPSQVYEEVLGADITAALLDGRSGNIMLTGKVVGLWQGAPVRDDLVSFFVASQKTEEGDEQGSTIYGPLHLLSCAGVHLWAVRNGDSELQALALDWLRFWVGFYRLCRTAAGGYLTVGDRSGGHDQVADGLPVPDAGWIAYIMAAANGEPLPLPLVKSLHLGPGESWIPGTVAGVASSLMVAGSDPRPMPAFGLLSPVHVYSDADGHAVVVIQERDGNGNTTGILLAAWIGGAYCYLPPKGGPHMREFATHATCAAEGSQAVYRSALPGLAEIRIDMPAGLVETVLGRQVGAQPVVPPVPPPVPPRATPPAGLTEAQAEDFSARLSLLVLARTDLPIRIEVLARLKPGIPLAYLAGLANTVASLGIGPGQPQKVDQDKLVADMRALAGA